MPAVHWNDRGRLQRTADGMRMNRPRDRSVRRTIASWRVADHVTPAATTPPRVAATSWRPTPADAVVIIPKPALIGSVAPAVAGNPDVPVTRVIDPLAKSIRIPGRALVLRVIRRPDIPL